MSYQIELTNQAKNDLDEIYSYIAYTLLSPNVADNMYHSIIDSIRSLDSMPLRNALMDDEPWKIRGLRRYFVKNYTIFYQVDETDSIVRIIRIMYSGRNIQNLLSDFVED
ncbi:type II toxin-antitoxin system RelE/ParE family toxin [bacterium]|nr:type II toxin-antitoxin system RelE/ParE family toxin [bacterium]